MNHLAGGVRAVVTGFLRAIIIGIFHPNVMMVMAFAAAVYAAYLTWGTRGALWTFAILAFLIAIAGTPSKE